MLTQDDKQFIVDTIAKALTRNNNVLKQRFDSITKRFDSVDKKFDDLDKKFEKRIDNLSTDVIDLFNATNNVIQKLDDKMSEKMDKILEELKDQNNTVDTHERRIEKLEEKVFPITP